jgi:hypothetical protein
VFVTNLAERRGLRQRPIQDHLDRPISWVQRLAPPC